MEGEDSNSRHSGSSLLEDDTGVVETRDLARFLREAEKQQAQESGQYVAAMMIQEEEWVPAPKTAATLSSTSDSSELFQASQSSLNALELLEEEVVQASCACSQCRKNANADLEDQKPQAKRQAQHTTCQCGRRAAQRLSLPGAIAVDGMDASHPHHHHECNRNHQSDGTLQIGDSSRGSSHHPHSRASNNNKPRRSNSGGSNLFQLSLSSLACATPVQDGSEGDNLHWPCAIPVDPDDPNNRQRRKKNQTTTTSPPKLPSRWTLMAAFLLLFTVVVVVVFLLLKGQEDTPSQSALRGGNNSTSSTNDVAQHWMAENISPTLPASTYAALQDTESPQYKAYEWLRHDPHLSHYPSWRKVQRLALATVYFATHGPTHWIVSEHWLSYDVSECHWTTKLDFDLSHLDVDRAIDDMLTHVRENGVQAGGVHWEAFFQQPPQGRQRRRMLEDPQEYHSTATAEEEDHDDHGDHHNGDHHSAATSVGAVHHANHQEAPTHTHDHDSDQEIHQQNYCDKDGVYRRFWPFTNGLHGTFPTEFFLLTNLQILGVCNNEDLTGSLPTELGLLTDLQFLFADENSFTGSLPTEIGQLESLRLWTMDDQPLLSGSIPTEIGTMGRGHDDSSSLFYLSMSRVLLLQGSLPSQLGQLSNALQALDFSSTQLTGTIPPSLSSLSRLQVLQVADNEAITGVVPTDVGLLEELKILNLQSNQLSGGISTDLARLSSLFFLDLTGNQLQGTIPHVLFQGLPHLSQVRLGDNQLTGTISTEIGLLGNSLEKVILSHNSLKGTLPSELGLLSSLNVLDVSFNSLSGFVPTQLSGLHRMEYVRMESTNVEGTLSDAFVSGWTSLKGIALNDTLITGTIAPDFCGLSDFVEFTCSATLCGCHCVCFN